MRTSSTRGAVLLLIDLQNAIDHPDWGVRNNPFAEEEISRLLTRWRAEKWPVWHVRHDSVEPASHYRPGQPGHDFKPEVAPLPGEPVIPKRTNNAFIGTGFEDRLREVCGEGRLQSLVGDHAQSTLLAGAGDHALNEVASLAGAAVKTVEASAAHDEGFAAIGERGVLAA